MLSALGNLLTIQLTVLMKNLLTYFLVVFASLQSHQTKAQLVWQIIDSTGGIQLGNYIFPSPTGVYVLTDIKSPSNPVSYGGKSNVLHYSDGGVLDWKKKIDLGPPNFEDFGVVAYPKIDYLGNLVFRKIKALSDFSTSFHLEKIRPDGTDIGLHASQWGGRLEFDTENNIYFTSANGSDLYLQTFTEGLVQIGNNPIEASGQLKVLNSNEFYLIGYKKTTADGEIQFCTQKITANGSVLWESVYPIGQPITLLDNIAASADAVDVEGNIYLLTRVARKNGKEENIVTKTSPNGSLLWSKKITSQLSNSLENVIFSTPKLLADNDGNCYLIGTLGNPWGAHDAFACKFDPSGAILWSNRLTYNINHPTRSASSDAFLINGNIYLTGGYSWSDYSNGSLMVGSDFMALKIKALNGNLDWKASYLNTPQNLGLSRGGESIIAKGLDSIFVTGVQISDNISAVLTVCFKDNQNVNGNLIGWTSFNLETTTSTFNSTETALSLNCFPNPATNTFQMSIPAEITPQKLCVYTANGRMVISQNSDFRAPINIHHLPSGIYIIELQTTAGVISRKLVKT